MSKPLALTPGEPAGIGGEITLKAWLSRAETAVTSFFLLDDPARLMQVAVALGLDVPVRTVAGPAEAAAAFPEALPVLPLEWPRPVVPGKPDSGNAGIIIDAIRTATKLVQQGDAAAIVTNPIQKEALYAGGFCYPGHTEFLADLAGGVTPIMPMMRTGMDASWWFRQGSRQESIRAGWPSL